MTAARQRPGATKSVSIRRFVNTARQTSLKLLSKASLHWRLILSRKDREKPDAIGSEQRDQLVAAFI
jgi:hypothetical protein